MFYITIALLALFFGWLAVRLLSTPRRRGLAFTGRIPGNPVIVVFSDSPSQNTRRLAVWIHEATGAPIVPIEVAVPYPRSYLKCVGQARKELKKGILPALKEGTLPGLDEYDVVFLGTPVWWGTAVPPVKSFLEASARLDGKTVVPFVTHGGGGAGHTFEDLRKSCPGASFKEGISLFGSDIVDRSLGRTIEDRVSPDAVASWLNRIFPGAEPGEEASPREEQR